MIFWISLLLVLINIGLLLGLGLKWSSKGISGVRKWVFLVNALFIVLNILIVQSVGQVEAGDRGVVLRFGAITNKTFGEGLYFKIPFVERVQIMTVQTQAYHAPAAAASKDLQDVKTDITVQFILRPEKVNYIYQTLRRDYGVRVIAPMVQESVKATTALFNAEELITQRPHVRDGIEKTLADRLAPFGIEVKGLAITSFEFSDTFTSSIEAKVVAVQKALEAENKLRQIEIEAKQRAAAAEGEAAQILTVATAQAEANRKVSASLTNELIRYTLVQRLGEQIKVILLPTDQTLILSDALLK